jgi:carbon monoxide dehydrogenase subunit G
VKLEYQGKEQVPASPDTVWAFVKDPHKVGHCLPEVVDLAVHDRTHFDATVRVGVGPVRGRFTLKFELHPEDAARHITIKGSGGGLGSAVDLAAGADVVQTDQGTILDWRGEAIMRGPVAAVGGRVLDSQAQKLISQTFANVRQALST